MYRQRVNTGKQEEKVEKVKKKGQSYIVVKKKLRLDTWTL